MRRARLLLLLILAVAPGPAVCAAEAPASSWFGRLKEKWDLNPRTSFTGAHRWKYHSEPDLDCQMARAGCPRALAPWAQCPEEKFDTGYYVGGGAAVGGEPRDWYREGTWGWDYALPWQRVKLDWFRTGRRQGGEGQYNPDRNNNPLDDLANP